MRTVHKYGLEVTDEQTIQAQRDWRPLSAQLQGGELVLWALVDTASPMVDHQVFVHGTGHEVNVAASRFVDTFQLSDMGLVFHVFTGK